MIEEFFSRYFDRPAGPVLRPTIEINHPVIRRMYDEYGLCTSRNGFFRVVDPEEWQESYMPWFLMMRDEDEVFEGPELYPFMTTAFGYVYVFANLPDEDLVGYIDITSNFHSMGDADSVFSGNLLDPIFRRFNLNGDFYEPLLKTEGEPDADECFGFFPPISLGGERELKNARRVKLREHLDLLAQASGLPDIQRGRWTDRSSSCDKW
jgi:hypothetical protein